MTLEPFLCPNVDLQSANIYVQKYNEYCGKGLIFAHCKIRRVKGLIAPKPLP